MAGKLYSYRGYSKIGMLSKTFARCGVILPRHYGKPLMMSTSSKAGYVHKLQNNHIDSVQMEYEEVMSFLSNTLSVENIFWKLKHARIGFLNEVLTKVKHNIPVTNFTLISLLTNESVVCDEERCLQQIKSDMLSLQGGQCYWFGIFVQGLLSQLGFDVNLIGAGDRAFDVMHDMHPAIVARDLASDGSLHLLETSPTYPIFQVIPLNCGGIPLSHNFGKVTRKFIQAGNGLLKYCHLLERGQSPRSNHSEIFEEQGERWEVHMTYRYNSPKTPFYFVDLACYVRLAPRLSSYYHKNIMIHGVSQDEWISVFNRKVTIRDIEGVLKSEFQLSSLSAVGDLIGDYFPQYPPSLVDKCISHVENSRKNMK